MDRVWYSNVFNIHIYIYMACEKGMGIPETTLISVLLIGKVWIVFILFGSGLPGDEVSNFELVLVLLHEILSHQ